MKFELIGAVVIAGMSFFAGWTTQGDRRDAAERAAELQRRDAADEVRRLVVASVARAATGHVQWKERERVVFETIERQVAQVVERPVYRDVCLDDDGVRIVNAAIAGRVAALGGEPGPTLR